MNINFIEKIGEREGLKDFIIGEYIQGDSPYFLRKKYGLSEHTIRRWISNPLCKVQIQKKWTEKENTLLRKLYKKKASKKEMMKRFPDRRYRECLMYQSRNLGLKKDLSLSHREHSGVVINDYYFDRWTPKMAYILGFIGADGWVYKNRLNIALHKKDNEILYKISKELGQNIKISFYNYDSIKRCEFHVRSSKLIKSLKRLGVTERKTFTLRPPKMRVKFVPHYLRGLIDGDGGIYYYKRLEFVLRGSKDIIFFALKWFNKISGGKQKLRYDKTKNGRSYRLMYAKYKAEKCLSWIYKDNPICLERKFNVFKKYKDCNLKKGAKW